MKKLNLILLLTVATCSQLFAQNKLQIQQYIETYRDIAIQEMIRSGVPASITLAQGIHETGAGTSQLVLKSNNHFGIKCKAEWRGESVSHDDDARGECFRKYSDPHASYRDHSDFLRTRAHYASLFDLDPTDYEGWAYGLKKAGYATNPKYPQVLIKLIRDYNLQDYTLVALGKKTLNENNPQWAVNTGTDAVINAHNTDLARSPEPAFSAFKQSDYPVGVFTINETKVLFVPAGTSYLKIAGEHNISLGRLFEFNDLKDGDVTIADGLLYLQRKRKTGASETHTVQNGETLRDIAQIQGIRLESLLEYNYLTDNATVAPGEKLYLQAKALQMPKLAGEKTTITHTAMQREPLVEKMVENNSLLVHVVQPKETMYSIARKYEVTVEDVKKWNDIETYDLKIGQQLRINKLP